MKKVLKWVGIVFIGLIVLGIILDAAKSPEQKAADIAKAAEKKAAELASRAEEIAAMPVVSAVQLARDYDANTVAADQKYKDKEFKVSGKVSDISTDFTGAPYVSMGGGFAPPQFSFDRDAADQLAKIKKGMQLTLLCIGKGDIAKTPMSGECRIVE
ncbi:MAG: OB-fold putative lipoprotein [Azoarcus sp.]|jgi:hypothetical protein|nr:OB-fold putative lipoprotein [Azoarcus sp.]